MKILKYFGTSKNGTFSLQGIKTLYDDGVARNDLQTVMSAINWQQDKDVVFCYGDGTPILFGDGNKIIQKPKSF